jgi:hypothetical protein
MVKPSNLLGFARDTAKPRVDELGLLPDQRAALLQSVARTEEQRLAGEAIPGDEVRAWLRSWGKENELSAPRPKLSRT